MDKVKKYNWVITSYTEEQVIKFEQGSFYTGDVNIEYVKASKYPSGIALSQEDIDKLDNGESIEVETKYIKTFIITKDD